MNQRGIFTCLMLMLLSAQAAQSREPFNIILVMGDDCSATEIGVYGGKYQTPGIDAMAGSGVMFNTAWCTPICSPTRAEIMTGRYGFRTGWYHNDLKDNKPLSDMNLIFSQVVRQAGYKTAIVGKWQLPGKPPQYGFDEHQLRAHWGMLPPGTEYTSGIESHNPDDYNYNYPSRYWHPSIVRNGEYIPTFPNDYGPDMHVDFILDFAARNREGPFLIYYTMNFTHHPYFPTPASIQNDGEKWVSDYNKNFGPNVEYMDYLMKRIMDGLDSLGIRENTVLIYTTDNGTGGTGKNKPTEVGCRVPLVVNCPGSVLSLGAVDQMVDFTDILPTLADLAGTRVPDGYVHDGFSFAPLLLGEPYREREWVFSYLKYYRMLRDHRWLLEACEGFIDCGGRPLLEGNARFFDCGDSRDGTGYVDVTGSDDPEVVEALSRFRDILEDLPAPAKPE